MKHIWALTLLTFASTASAQVVESEPRSVFESFEFAADGLTSDRAAALAVEHSLQVEAALLDQRQAESSVASSKVALWPTLDLRASYTRLGEVDIEPISFGGTEFDLFPQNLNSLGTRATLTVPVSAYFTAIGPAIRASQAGLDATSAQVTVQARTVALRAKETYFGYVQAVASEQISADAITVIETSLVDIEALAKAGQATRADVLRGRSQLADAQIRLAQARAGKRRAQVVLQQQLGVAIGDPIVLGENVFIDRIEAAPSVTTILEQAKTNRPEFQVLEHTRRAQNANVDIQSRGLWPSLAIVANADLSDPNSRYNGETGFNFSWDATAALTWSPNRFVDQKLAADRAEADLLKTATQEALLEQQLVIEATDVLAELEIAQETLAASRIGLEAALEGYRASRALFSVGEVTASELLEAQTTLRGAQFQRLNAYIAARVAETRLIHSQGLSANPTKGNR